MQRAITLYTPMIYTRKDLESAGMSPRRITSTVRAGLLIRLRRNRYARPDLDDTVAEAARIGGRVTCLSLLQLLGVFVLTSSALHLQVSQNGSRLGPATRGAPRLHWAKEREHEHLHVTSLSVAIRHSVRCQSPRAAVATLDSLLHHGLITLPKLQSLFLELPERFQTLLGLVDPSAESGPETFVRLLLRAIGVSFETQVLIDGVGRVDFVVDGWLIIECDSKEFHEGWVKQKQDRSRDLAAARLGYVTIRPLASDILHRSDTVQRALREVIEVLGPKLGPSRRSQLRKRAPRGGETGARPGGVGASS